MSQAAARPGAPGTVGGPSLLQVDHESATVVLRRLLQHPIDDVWTAITDPTQFESWFMAKVTRDTSNGTVEHQYPNGLHATGRVLEWNPPRVYEHEWNAEPRPDLPHGEHSIIRWELSPQAGGTLLVLTQRKLSRRTAEVFSRGLSTFLDRLAAHMDGAPMPEPPWLRQGRPPSRDK
jgi:uncharacterized protein YndB with AHSA1/START domain